MPRGHKYIKKYRNSHGNWTYVYDLPKPEDIIRPWPPAHKAPKMHETSAEDLKGWAEVDSSDYRYRMPNSYTPREYGSRSKGPKISSNSTNKHNPYQHYERRVRNTNHLLSSTTRTTNRVGLAGGPESTYVTDYHETGKIERAYNRGKRKATKLRRSLKRAGSKAISRGKQAVRNFLPHTEIHVHDAELH